VDPNAPVELYTLANPVMIVSFQLLITRMARKWLPVKSILVGVAVTTAGMALNIIPPLFFADQFHKVGILGLAIPLAGVFLVISIASMAVGEMMASPRIYEYLGAIAPRGEEGLYLGYANLPIALASLIGGPLGGALFQRYIAGPVKDGLPTDAVRMWVIITLIGVASMVGLTVYNKVMKRRLAEQR
jgi:POT family proton-dependent oligopeptide transporter